MKITEKQAREYIKQFDNFTNEELYKIALICQGIIVTREIKKIYEKK